MSGGRKTLPLWKEVSLDTIHGRRASLFAMMDPSTFIRLTTGGEDGYLEIMARDRFGTTLDSRSEYNQWSMPHLVVVHETGRVVEHDGRHRSAMVAKAGGAVVPVAVRFREPSVWTLNWMQIRGRKAVCREERFSEREDLLAFRDTVEASNTDADQNVMFDFSVTEGALLDADGLPPFLVGQYNPAIRFPTADIRAVKPKNGHPPEHTCTAAARLPQMRAACVQG